MKKRNVLVSLLLALALMITACGQPSPFVGTWKGNCDLTALIIEYVVGGNEEIAQYMEGVDGLEFVIDFEFTENEMSMSVEEASVDSFIENFEISMKNMMEEILVDELAGYGISYEEYIAESGMDSDEFLQSMLDEMDMLTQMEAMMNTMAEALELSGSYMYDEEKITIVYEDGTYEEMLYVFEGDVLTITFVDDQGTEYPIICKMQK